jgi:hypothetical protein
MTHTTSSWGRPLRAGPPHQAQHVAPETFFRKQKANRKKEEEKKQKKRTGNNEQRRKNKMQRDETGRERQGKHMSEK